MAHDILLYRLPNNKLINNKYKNHKKWFQCHAIIQFHPKDLIFCQLC